MKIQNYIGGKFVPPVSASYLENVNPATGEVYSYVPDSDERDVEMAVEAATDAFRMWKSTSYEKRSRLLLSLAEKIEKNLEKLALAETNDNGKPLWLSKKVDIPRASANFRFYATAILHLHSESHFMENMGINYTLLQPVGVAGCISPWNLPLYLFSWKIAPALAAGCTVVAKPSELTPMTAYMLSELAAEADIPDGVLNIVHGLGPKAGGAIVAHPHTQAISFTGGTATGKIIAQTAAPMFKKLSLELGGKNPSIVFEDCHLEQAVKGVLQAAFTNQGQICLCGSRILIQESIYEDFKAALLAEIAKMPIGDPLEENTKIGAVISETHMHKILSYIQLAKEEGGSILCGGEPYQPEGRCKNGYFVMPTLIEGLSQQCRTNQEEIFGPVATLAPFQTEEEAIHMANAVKYGLSANVWTKNLDRAMKVAEQLECGIVWINSWLLRDLRTPFGGMKQSGIGREGGFEAIKFFTEPKNVCIKYR